MLILFDKSLCQLLWMSDERKSLETLNKYSATEHGMVEQRKEENKIEQGMMQVTLYAIFYAKYGLMPIGTFSSDDPTDPIMEDKKKGYGILLWIL